jgi:pimeloyl-[acyl-carrier protein] methyl ester esterase
MKTHKSVVFIPGWGMNHHIFTRLAHRLHIASPHLMSLPTLKHAHLEPAINHLASLIPDSSVIIAWSLGGLLALKLSTLFPQRCEKLVLLASTPKFLKGKHWHGIDIATAQTWIQQFNQQPERLLHHFHRLVHYPNRDKAIKKHILDHRINADNTSLLHYLTILFDSDLREDYATINTPLLHILGGQDAIVTSSCHQLQRLNAKVKLKTLRKAGHALFLTHLSRVSNEINAFLRE